MCSTQRGIQAWLLSLREKEGMGVVDPTPTCSLRHVCMPFVACNIVSSGLCCMLACIPWGKRLVGHPAGWHAWGSSVWAFQWVNASDCGTRGSRSVGQSVGGVKTSITCRQWLHWESFPSHTKQLLQGRSQTEQCFVRLSSKGQPDHKDVNQLDHEYYLVDIDFLSCGELTACVPILPHTWWHTSNGKLGYLGINSVSSFLRQLMSRNLY